jgi:uncharacterized protein (DUF362 family)
VSRRGFLRRGVAVAGAVAGGKLLGAAAGGPTVAVVRDKSKKAIQDRTVDGAIVQRLVDRAVMACAGKDDAAKAWATYVSPKDKVAVKFNGLFRSATTHPEVVQAAVKGLLAAGAKPENIVVYDRDDRALSTAGLQSAIEGVSVRGSEKVRGKTLDAGYAKSVKAGPVDTRITKLLTEADVLINLPMMKTHGLAGITGALKNHLGTVPNARDFHRDTCRFVGDLNALAPIKAKTRLCICDALYGLYHGGPAFRPKYRWDYHGIVASADPVALDAILADIIRAKREAEGLSPYHKTPVHLARAAELGLGVADLKAIKRVELDV